ncbi:MAG: hypothetical protein AAF721_11700 [Myxococcota bacterium]
MSEPDQTPQTRSTSTAVVVRHVTLVDGAELKVHEDRSVFVALDEPPPIRTVVQLWRGDEARAVVVDRIVEAPDADSGEQRGFFGLPAGDEAIAAATRVGTEHLDSPSGDEVEGNEDAGRSDASPEGNISMAMPSPVVVYDHSEEIEVGGSAQEADAEPSGDDASGETASEAASEASEDAAGEAAPPSADSDASNTGEATSGRRRKGRGRKKRK